MKILVTGSNGQLGSEIKRLSSQYNAANFTFVDIAELDLLDGDAIKDFFNRDTFDFVIHCAAYTAVDRAEEEPDIAYRVNADAVKFIATACKEHHARLIHISTDYVFDGLGNVPITEDAATNPLSVYGQSKLDGENYARSICDNAYVIRTAWVYSTFGKNFVKTILKAGKERDTLNVVMDQVGSPTYARDLAGCILNMIVKIDAGEVDSPGIYHFSNEGVISWFDFAWFIVKYYRLPCKVNAISSSAYKTLATRPIFSVLDKSKIKRVFGVTVPHWNESLEDCLKALEDSAS